MDIKEYKIWFEAYFNSLYHSDSISKKQVELLKSKIDEMLAGFDKLKIANNHLDEPDAIEAEINAEDVIETFKNDYSRHNSPEPFDDLPF